ncbi:MAG: sulfate adenylyltransferase [Chloroflexota bacterium]
MGAPHGGTLVERQASPEVAAAWQKRLRGGELARLTVSPREACDLELLGNGAFSPLQGFLEEADYRSVVRDLRLANGLVWPIPVVLGAGEAEAAPLREGQDVALIGPDGDALAILHLREKYLADVRAEAQEVYRTTEDAHPGVRAVYARSPVLLAGPVTVLRRPARAPVFEPYRFSPAETRRAFATRGWRTVVAFQTRNPVHRAHEYLIKTALEGVDGLLLHPLVGETKDDDIPADVRLRCYEALLASYFPADRVVFAVLPAAMRYAGPREAIFHALMRKNHGCTHFIVGRDHAGVGNYYGTYDAQRIFEQFTEEELGIRPVFFEHSFYCTACGGMASAKTCAHGEDQHVTLSGTKVRSLLAAGQAPPPEFSRPEVAEILVEAATERTAVAAGG